MILSQYNLNKIQASDITLPDESIFELPEKVLQFGTGVLLRGLPDYYIDKANRNGIFNGRVVVVKSTDTGSAGPFDKQDGLYTLYMKGINNGTPVNEQVVCSAISRVLSAGTDWETILQVAHNPELQLIISNTTEVGIQLVQDDIRKHPPVSYPGKLLAILYERYKAFGGKPDSGLIIVPTELIVDNGKKLEAIVLELAHLNKLEPAFMDWLEENNRFCNSLVDRIVPGKPDATLEKQLQEESGYEDDLRTMSETYSLWAIEGDEKVAQILSFSKADQGVVIVPDIELYRELKLRLLNGTHTLSCAVAFLSGFRTVKEAMDNSAFSEFITQIMLKEIAPAIPYQVNYNQAAEFAAQVLDRFRNPNIEHQWISISAQYSAKMGMRVVPLLLNHYKLHSSVPQRIALGFAAFLRFMKTEQNAEGKFIGHVNGAEYTVTDSQAETFCKVWQNDDIKEIVNTVLKDKNLWNADLSVLPGFAEAVAQKLESLIAQGTRVLLEEGVNV
ncbi:tagaturonate reductase [Mucilaginibacter robiniae]|uniref:Tagaturonate reductase n=1 Tax=Mucilaginibacter robiniae TaxID=2728022 RepID=A0A7L5E194_9SPHI|nr:tagaturonate reductase [Mucilaginibacter robiniae]QJD94593.1 tagaturonate reductase [Mucilaginibacter robiniae]